MSWHIVGGGRIVGVVVVVLSAVLVVAACAVRWRGEELVGVEVERKQSGSSSSKRPLGSDDPDLRLPEAPGSKD